MIKTTAPRTAIARILGLYEGHIKVVGPYGRQATGLAMQADRRGEGFHLVLVSGTTALMALGPYGEDDIVAEWRILSAKTGLPLMVRLTNGSTLAVMPQIGNVRMGTAKPGSRKTVLAARRPRFLASRKGGAMPAKDMDKSEIDSLEGRQK